METTMTVGGVVSNASTVLSSFALYLGIAVAIPLGFALVPRIKRWVTKR